MSSSLSSPRSSSSCSSVSNSNVESYDSLETIIEASSDEARVRIHSSSAVIATISTDNVEKAFLSSSSPISKLSATNSEQGENDLLHSKMVVLMSCELQPAKEEIGTELRRTGRLACPVLSNMFTNL